MLSFHFFCFIGKDFHGQGHTFHGQGDLHVTFDEFDALEEFDENVNSVSCFCPEPAPRTTPSSLPSYAGNEEAPAPAASGYHDMGGTNFMEFENDNIWFRYGNKEPLEMKHFDEKSS